MEGKICILPMEGKIGSPLFWGTLPNQTKSKIMHVLDLHNMQAGTMCARIAILSPDTNTPQLFCFNKGSLQNC